jgi:SAM-dependent methyltransferase
VPGARQYREGAGQAASELAGAVASTGRSARQVASVLDFGCGAGRVLPQFVALAAASRGAGCDVDGDAIAWAQANLPGFQWTVSSFEPPLPYPADSFDLVYSISVFSHLGARLEALWLRELRRVLVAGGVALLSVHGAHAFEEFRSGRVRTAWCAADVFDRSALSDHERVFVPYVRSTWTEGDLPGIGREYGLAFHGSERVRQAWGDQLEVIDVLERTVTGWQDLVVCRNGKEEE